MRRLRPLAALAVVALMIAACSNEQPAESGKTDSTPGAGKTPTRRDKAMQFAACMRQNGVTAFPDPEASGELTIDGVLNGSSLNPDGPAWTKAIAACKDLQPSGFTGHKRTAEQQKAALGFAQCIRDNGVEDFPDPTQDGPLVDTRRIPSAAGSEGMAILNAAMQKCRDASAAAGVSGP
jgi:hypothetical protein